MLLLLSRLESAPDANEGLAPNRAFAVLLLVPHWPAYILSASS
jgi:hypothetical protein